MAEFLISTISSILINNQADIEKTFRNFDAYMRKKNIKDPKVRKALAIIRQTWRQLGPHVQKYLFEMSTYLMNNSSSETVKIFMGIVQQYGGWTADK